MIWQSLIKGFALIILNCIFLVSHSQPLKIVLETEDLIKLLLSEEVKIGFKYERFGGKYKLAGSLFGYKLSMVKFDLKVKGAYYDKKKGTLKVDSASLEQNGGNVIISYCNPDASQYSYTDTLKIPKIIDIEAVPQRWNYNISNPLMLNIHFNTGQKKFFESTQALEIIRRLSLNIDIENASLNNKGFLLTKPYQNTLTDAYLRIFIYGTDFKKLIVITYDFQVNAYLKFNGMEGNYGSEGSKGQKGENGKQVYIEIKHLTKSIFLVNIKGAILDTQIVMNMELSKITIESKGGNGGKGSRGEEGIAAGTYNTTYTSGGVGYMGHSGGDGGDGGEVLIKLPGLFAPFIDFVIINNEGGFGGTGGKGGKGGLNFDPESKQTLLNILLTTRGERGRPGYKGFNGFKGNVRYNWLD